MLTTVEICVGTCVGICVVETVVFSEGFCVGFSVAEEVWGCVGGCVVIVEGVSVGKEPTSISTDYTLGTSVVTATIGGQEYKITVTVKDDVITDIKGTTMESDDYYFSMAKKEVFQQILDRQQSDVDACSGATYSSKAIMHAVQKALDSAKKH